jgi:hypothetical protein
MNMEFLKANILAVTIYMVIHARHILTYLLKITMNIV